MADLKCDHDLYENSSSIKNKLPGDDGRCMKQAAKRNYKSKKRTFHGNKHTSKPKSKVVVNNNNTEQDTVLKRRTRSETKILNIPVKEEERTVNGYRLFDMVIFEDIIKSLGCPECKHTSSLYVKEEESKRKGCASCIVIKCIQCTYAMEKYTSQSIKNIEKRSRE